jgi:hypothetical protein
MPREVSGWILVRKMSVSAVMTRAAPPRVRRTAPDRVAESLAEGRPETPRTFTRPVRRLELDILAAHWERAFDADQRALAAATGVLPASELVRRQRELRLERLEVAASLARLARVVGAGPVSRR